MSAADLLGSVIAHLIAAPDFRGKDWLLRQLLRPLTGRFLRSGYGPWLRVDAADATCRFSLRCTRDYDPVFAEVDRLRPGMAFIDVGANAGLFTIVGAERVRDAGAVVAFEPNPPAFAALTANLGRNGVRNAHAFELALGPETASVAFDPGPAGHSGKAHLAAAGPLRVEQAGPEKVLALLDPLIGERPTMIKIDVEGAEARVVEALGPLLRRAQVETAIVEIDSGNLARFGAAPEAVYAAMSRFGFGPRRGPGAAEHYDEVFARSGPPA
ncbi:MAG TPA: FkbM family methyltransferase [Allosphingosinicella sp.]|nr:FkbM family methyltransferase [Allosphingosinicella sp.]